jgi:CubicO group peptidase (beta-lactamase class C family)
MNALLFSLVLAQAAAVADLERAVVSGIARGVYPGAVVIVGTSDSILVSHGFGRLTWTASSPVPSPDSTLYDLASLTKVVATTPAAMLLVERGALDLNQPVAAYLPEFSGPGKEAVTVRHLLVHNSGLRAFLRLDSLARDAASARHLVFTEPLRWKPGARVEYSDLNAMLLGWIVERVSGVPLNRFVADNLLTPMGMPHATFNPPRRIHLRVAPTGLWRGQAIAGRVHDQNSARLGGIAGHAGLFATGSELARYAQLLLAGGVTRDGHRVLRSATIAAFTRRQAGNRALGWELRDTTTADNAGRWFSARAYGHTGYTGTSLWIDPERNLFVVILTNRVYAPRNSRSITRLKEIRGQVADAAVSLHDPGCAPAVPPPAVLVTASSSGQRPC